jgi:DNA-binding response OmpR family regulator
MKTCILVVDDDESVQRTFKRSAERAGYGVQVASNGSDALAIAAGGKVDLVLLDINMPGIDGRDVLSRLKSNPATSNIPVLIQSARVDQLDRHCVLDLGAVDFLMKPMLTRELLGKIDRAIAGARKRASARPSQL